MYFLSHHAAFVTRSPVFNLARRNLFCSKALPHSWECPKSNRTLLGEASSESSRGGKDEMWSVWSHSPEPGVEGGQWGGRPRSIQEENAQHPELVVDRSPLPRDVQAGGVSTSPPPPPQWCGQRRTALVGELNIDLEGPLPWRPCQADSSVLQGLQPF